MPLVVLLRYFQMSNALYSHVSSIQAMETVLLSVCISVASRTGPNHLSSPNSGLRIEDTLGKKKTKEMPFHNIGD